MKLISMQPTLHKSDLERLNWLLDDLEADECADLLDKVGFIRDILLSMRLEADFDVQIEDSDMSIAIFNRRQTMITKDGLTTIVPRDMVILNKKAATRIHRLVAEGHIDTDWEVYHAGSEYAIARSFDDLGENQHTWLYIGLVSEAF